MLKMVSAEINQYCVSKSMEDSALLKELTQFTYDNEDIPQMISGQQVGNVLQGFIKMTGAERVIEVGMFTGYSALTMAEVLPEHGEVHTCELMEKHIKTAQSFFNRSCHGHKIRIYHGPATESIDQMESGKFDFAFIDADKMGYLDYYQKCMTKIKRGGVIVLDNMLWSGQVVNPQDDDSKMLVKTAAYIHEDERVFNYLLPIRDGLMVCIKI